jgi:NADH-quinone oxidoreductase subunit A
MALFALLVILLISLGGGLLLQWWPSRYQTIPTYPQRAPFLGGGLPDTHAWSRYHVRYYPMTLLLIAFEMEMMFMYPWAVVYVAEGMKAVMEMGMFLAILSVGILYGWREGVFKWQ